MFDTHCHLNFKAFAGKVGDVVTKAKEAGIDKIVVPGTDLESSIKAIEIAQKYDDIYAAVGIHPHHIYEHIKSKILNVKTEVEEIEKLIAKPKAVAIGEVGLDRHYYRQTKYTDYQIDGVFIELQKLFFLEQIKLAHKYKKALIIHNREAKTEMLKLLTENRQLITDYRCVFHCCEPDSDLLEFAQKHNFFIGVDGDITYRKDKQEFIKKIPLRMLVLETDSPFLLPEPLRSQKKYPNTPANLKLITGFIAEILAVKQDKLNSITDENSRRLFQIS